MKWEYDLLMVGVLLYFRIDLERKGNDGWELVQVVDGVAIFKRPKKEKPIAD